MPRNERRLCSNSSNDENIISKRADSDEMGHEILWVTIRVKMSDGGKMLSCASLDMCFMLHKNSQATYVLFLQDPPGGRNYIKTSSYQLVYSFI